MSADLLLLVECMMSGLLDGAGALFAAGGGEAVLSLSANSVEKLSLVIMEFTIDLLCDIYYYCCCSCSIGRLVSAGHG